MISVGPSHRTEPIECLRCNCTLDGATQVDGDSIPEAGAVLLCLSCGYVMVLDKQRQPRAPFKSELREFQHNGTLITALMAITAMWRAIALSKEPGPPYAGRSPSDLKTD